MSADALPISPTRFAAAIKDLSLSSLHLKVLELRNSIAHLDYSNEQLRPFAEGLATAISPSFPPTSSETQQREAPDQDCIDAIRENELVISRMQERIRLLREEVEARGFSWAEFQSKEEAEKASQGAAPDAGVTLPSTTTTANGVNGVNGHSEEEEGRNPWRDGTFTTGVIRGGEVHMDEVAGQRALATTATAPTGGSLTDEELRRRMEDQLRGLGDDEEGLHL